MLLLNTALTVVKGYAGSHTELWRPFTEDLITSLSLHKNNIIFVLWGKKAQEYARIVLSGRIVLDVTEGATHYHATYVRPSWAKTKTKTTRIDKHIFYRWEK